MEPFTQGQNVPWGSLCLLYISESTWNIPPYWKTCTKNHQVIFLYAPRSFFAHKLFDIFSVWAQLWQVYCLKDVSCPHIAIVVSTCKVNAKVVDDICVFMYVFLFVHRSDKQPFTFTLLKYRDAIGWLFNYLECCRIIHTGCVLGI